MFWNFIYVCNYGPGGNVGYNGEDPFLRPYQTDQRYITTSTTARPMTTTPWWQTPARTTQPTTVPWWLTTTLPWWLTTTTTRPTVPPTIPNGNGNSGLSGGLRGPQCLPNVDRSRHTSCLSDSPYLEKLFQFEIDEVLRVHNQVRSQVQPRASRMPMLTYSTELAVVAERWAAQCPEQHDRGEDRKTAQYNWVGQNLCWKSGADETWTECINAWASEVKDWSYGIGQLYSGAVVGHYTQ